MSKINDLIQELCPEGVTHYKLEDVFEIRGGYTPSKANDNFWREGTIPWFRMEDIRLNGRVLTDAIQKVSSAAVKKDKPFEANSLIVATTATIGEHALITTPFLANQQFSILTRKSEFQSRVYPKFAFYVGFSLSEHCLQNTNVSGFASVNMEAFRSFSFPVPPIEVQKEIVSILDKFTQLEAELEAELEARRTQYEVTRDRLLDFTSDLESHPLKEMIRELKPESYYFVTLDEVAEIHIGEFVKKTRQDSEAPYPVYNGGTTETGFYHEYNSKAESIVISARGSIGFVNFLKTKFWAGNSCYVIRPRTEDFDVKYLYYYLKASEPQLYRLRAIGGIPALNLGPVKNFLLRIPPLEVQKEIVSILDTLDALVNDMTIGLPAETSARRKQYEHYRNKLLTFKELDAA